MRKFLFLLFLLSILTNTAFAASETNTNQDTKYADFFIRWGQGGFADSRSPLNKLGGGQLSLDVKPVNQPVNFSISGEYYTNSPNPTHPYEISGAVFFNAHYMSSFTAYPKAKYFLGGGVGTVTVPRGENQPDTDATSAAYDLETGINVLVYKFIGLYGEYKYLYAQKSENGSKLIDFKEHIILIGLTFNFSW